MGMPMLQARPTPSPIGMSSIGLGVGVSTNHFQTADMERLRKTADDFLAEQQAAQHAISLYRQKAEAAEAQSSKLAGQLEKEQADNARSSAKLKGTEKHITDVLAQISTVKEMHHLLLQTLGEASDSIQTVDRQRERLSHSFDERFKLCQELTIGMDAMKAEHVQELKLYKDQLSAAEETQTQLQTEGEASKQEITLLTERLILQAKRVEELDAEIKHAFADLERNERERQELHAKSEELASQLTGAEQHMEDLMGRLNSKAIELEEAQAHHSRVKEDYEGQVAERDEALCQMRQKLDELGSMRANDKEKHAAEVARLRDEMHTKEEEWKAEKARMDSIAREADRKHQQLADRTALELDKLQSSAKQEVASAHAKAKELQSQLGDVQEELSRAKCQNADLIASQKTSAAQHEEQLNKITEGRQQVEKELKSVESQHESAITEANKELEIKATELEEMRLSRDAMVASAEKEQDTVKKLRAEIAQLHADKAALKADAAAEQDKIIKQSAEDAQQSIITQQARFDAEMGLMKNRLAHENAMSEQRQRDSAAMVESLGTELAERNTVIAHLEEELQQKEHLLQQISVAAAPAAAALPVAPSPQRPAPAKMARIPRNAPQRMMENSSMLYPAQQTLSAEGYSDESGGPHMVADDREEDDVEAVRPSPHRKRITTPPRKAGKQHATPQGAAYEKQQLPYLNHADMPTEDERNYGAPQRRQVRKAGRKSRQVDNGKAEAMAVLAMKASKRNSVFSTMSARSLCSDDERAADYGAVDKAPPGYVNMSAGRFAKQAHTRKRSRLFGTAATDIFGKASMDPYSYGV
ncbi:g13283 [Coccomyxa viridis]|uniref:G13283 protein n=1 Tax=Coccomyxa viridis TaxID=1274662 RepID=A0ABP1GCR2_9CHLO